MATGGRNTKPASPRQVTQDGAQIRWSSTWCCRDAAGTCRDCLDLAGCEGALEKKKELKERLTSCEKKLAAYRPEKRQGAAGEFSISQKRGERMPKNQRKESRPVTASQSLKFVAGAKTGHERSEDSGRTRLWP
jgi:hypothetical protein